MNYFFQRLVTGFLAIIFIASATFFLMHAIPGDPISQEKAMSVTVRKNLEERYGLNKPLWEQYGIYMSKIFLHGDFGVSYKQENRRVNDIIKDHFWVSGVLGLTALVGALVVGVFLGVVAALKRHSWIEALCLFIAVVGVSIPSFCLAYLFQHIFAIKLKWLPVGGWSQPSNIVLPALSLGILVMASLARLMRSSMLDVLSQDYIRTARAKGMSTLNIVFKHQIRNAILPIIVYFGPLTASVMTGTFVIESIFGIPGLGQFFVNSVAELDYTVIMGLTVFYAGFSIVVILVNDFSLVLIDPRVRIAK